MGMPAPSPLSPLSSEDRETHFPHSLYAHLFRSLFKTVSRNLLLFTVSLEVSTFAWWGCSPTTYAVPLFFLLLCAAMAQYWLTRPRPVYLVDFSCLKPPSHLRVPFSTFREHASLVGFLNQESIDFMMKVIRSSGQGEMTYLPSPLHFLPPRTNHSDCVDEACMVLFPVMDDLLAKTCTSPRAIDFLIVNCSGFCPSPSLTSILVNAYGMREDLKNYNLSGMGCSAGILGVDLARRLLDLHPDSIALVFSTEIISTGWYPGKDRRKLVLNCLFRMGCSGLMLSNRKDAKRRAKYELLCTVRTQMAFDDRAYRSAVREEDEDGITGVTLERDLLHVARELLVAHLSVLGRRILPFSEKALYVLWMLRRRYSGSSKEIHVPDFKSAVHHFCIPPSGKGLIKEIGKSLKLRPQDVEPALMTLHRFGNQSAAALWYELAYIEAKGRVKKGDKVWQVGMGTGPKANSAVWRSLRSIKAEGGPWSDCIDAYPVVD
ncbi:3-ketoacyl-CoA synthase 4 [Nymphaea thermarum]|nr:3-ketoacyl-CoA synthase 4 [Nymphaea thermarum]